MDCYTIIYTTAPEGYDWAYSFHLGNVGVSADKQEPLRQVLVPTIYADNQVGRYRSGLYLTFVDWDEVTAANKLGGLVRLTEERTKQDDWVDVIFRVGSSWQRLTTPDIFDDCAGCGTAADSLEELLDDVGEGEYPMLIDVDCGGMSMVMFGSTMIRAYNAKEIPELQFKSALAKFAQAALDLNRAWDSLDTDDLKLAAGFGYPESLPSFDELTFDIRGWADKVEQMGLRGQS